MSEQRLQTLKDLSLELHKDPEHEREYRRKKPFYDLMLEIINRRNALGLSQKELAERMGTHQSAISRIQSAESNPRLGTIIEIAEALDATVEIKFVANQHLTDDDLSQISVSTHSSSSQSYRAATFKPMNDPYSPTQSYTTPRKTSPIAFAV